MARDFQQQFAPDLPSILCTSEIHQVWTNLLSNATDAVLERGEGYPGRVKVTTAGVADGIVVTIEDNGTGVPPEKIGSIFDPFMTTKPMGKGTGLGLSIVAGIVKKHHGTVEVDSRPGRTVFEVHLPLGTAPTAADESASDITPPAATPVPARAA